MSNGGIPDKQIKKKFDGGDGDDGDKNCGGGNEGDYCYWGEGVDFLDILDKFRLESSLESLLVRFI